MNIDDIRKEKGKLKAAIIASSTVHIADFEAKTGLNIKTCSLEFIQNTNIGESESKYILSGATVEADLEI